MAKKKLSISALIEEAQHIRPGVSIAKRLPPKTWAAINRDMRALVEAEANGQAIPSQARIVQYVAEEHGVTVNRSTVGGWLNTLRAGKEL